MHFSTSRSNFSIRLRIVLASASDTLVALAYRRSFNCLSQSASRSSASRNASSVVRSLWRKSAFSFCSSLYRFIRCRTFASMPKSSIASELVFAKIHAKLTLFDEYQKQIDNKKSEDFAGLRKCVFFTDYSL